MKKVKELTKSKKFWIVVGIVFVIGLIYNIGYGNAKIELEDRKVNAEELDRKIVSLEQDLKRIELKLEETQEELSNAESELEEALKEQDSRLEDRKSEVDEILTLIDDRDQLNGEIESLEDNLNSKQSEIDSLDSQIEDRQQELDKLEGDIVKAIDKPIELLSGEWIVGVDVAPGRYQASGTSNFIVYSSSGQLKVNTILGDAHGDGDYVFFADEGDFIEASAKTTLTPVE